MNEIIFSLIFIGVIALIIFILFSIVLKQPIYCQRCNKKTETKYIDECSKWLCIDCVIELYGDNILQQKLSKNNIDKLKIQSLEK